MEKHAIALQDPPRLHPKKARCLWILHKKLYVYEKINLCQKARRKKEHSTEEHCRDLTYFAGISAMQIFKTNRIVQLRKQRPTDKLGMYKHVRLQ